MSIDSNQSLYFNTTSCQEMNKTKRFVNFTKRFFKRNCKYITTVLLIFIGIIIFYQVLKKPEIINITNSNQIFIRENGKSTTNCITTNEPTLPTDSTITDSSTNDLETTTTTTNDIDGTTITEDPILTPWMENEMNEIE